MGLGALYLLHLLAQDYMKIRPAAKLAKFLLSKRDLDDVIKNDEVFLDFTNIFLKISCLKVKSIKVFPMKWVKFKINMQMLINMHCILNQSITLTY